MATQDDALTALERVLARWGNPLPPMAGADDAGDGDGDGDQAGVAGDGAADQDQDGAEDAGKEPDWKAHSRKHEREAKKARAERDDLAKQLKEREDADKSDQEKALDKARKEAADEARKEATAGVRDRLLKAEVKALAAGRFADPDDAMRLLDIDGDDIFNDEGDVQTDALEAALDELLERKPHLAATANTRGSGDSDAGKGKGAGKSLEDMSVEEHLKRIQERNKT